MMATESYPPNAYPAMYPYTRIEHRMNRVAVTYWHLGDSSGPVLTMLAALAPGRR
jgi:hypothetical protein